jgi:hypothetical protein
MTKEDRRRNPKAMLVSFPTATPFNGSLVDFLEHRVTGCIQQEKP